MLAQYDTIGDLETYLNSLSAVGLGTYHDVGMIWGARMISNAGVFADSPDTHANMPVARHIIFMTDGQPTVGIVALGPMPGREVPSFLESFCGQAETLGKAVA